MDYTTKTGFTLKLYPVSDTLITKSLLQVEKQFKESNDYCPPPTYEVSIDFNDGTEPVKEVHEHTEATLVVMPDEIIKEFGGDTDAAKKAADERTEKNLADWQRYQDSLRLLEAKQNEQRTIASLTMGVDFNMPEDMSWMNKQKFLGIEIPEDETELKYHFLSTVVLTSPIDLLNVLQQITKLSYEGIVSEEDVEAAMSLFRGKVARKSTKRGRRGNSNRKSEVTSEPLDVHAEVIDSPHGEGMGADAWTIQAASD